MQELEEHLSAEIKKNKECNIQMEQLKNNFNQSK